MLGRVVGEPDRRFWNVGLESDRSILGGYFVGGVGGGVWVWQATVVAMVAEGEMRWRPDVASVAKTMHGRHWCL